MGREIGDMSDEHAATGGITFFYYDDIEPASRFYGGTLGFELVEDQTWARIYRIHRDAYVGVVNGARGFCRPQPQSAVLLTVLVDDVDAWYERLTSCGTPILAPITTHEDIQVRCFFAADPGGYALEFQRFLDPSISRRFAPS